MMAYSWLSFGPMFYAIGGTLEWVAAIDNILICSIQNEVQDSYYGNQTFIANTWKPASNYFYLDLLWTYGWWWYAIVLDILTGFTWEVVQIPVNIFYMLTYAANTALWIDGIRNRDCYNMSGYLLFEKRWETGCL